MTAINGTIVHPRIFETIIAQGANEGLVLEAGMTDGVFQKICSTNRSDQLIRLSLELIVSEPNIFISQDSWLLDRLKVDGLEHIKLNAKNLSKPSEDEMIKSLEAFPIPLVLQSLEAQGKKYSMEALREIVLDIKAAEEEENEHTQRTGKTIPSGISALIMRVMDRLDPGELVFSEHEYNQFREWNERKCRLNPVLSEISLISTLSKAANENRLRLCLPIGDPWTPNENNELYLNEFDHNPTTVVLRIVSSKMSRLHFGRNLKESIRLSGQSSTAELRELITTWNKELLRGSLTEVEKITTEVSKAQILLKRNEKAKRIGSWVTYVAVPLSVAEFFLGLPPVAGISVGVVGKSALMYSNVIQKRTHWTMFGL